VEVGPSSHQGKGRIIRSRILTFFAGSTMCYQEFRMFRKRPVLRSSGGGSDHAFARLPKTVFSPDSMETASEWEDHNS